MEYAGIFLIGAIVGIACAKLMVFLTCIEDARTYLSEDLFLPF